MRKRYFILAIIISACLVWSTRHDAREVDVVNPTFKPRSVTAAENTAKIVQSNATALPPPSVAEVKTSDLSPMHGADPFRPVSFIPPPPPPPAPPPTLSVVKPAAPSFPFRYFGRVIGVEGETFYLVRDDVLIPVVPAQVIDNTYRVEAVGASEIRVTYLPLQETTTLSLPGG